MKKQLFHKASIRLASTYLLVLMAVSLLFSISLYRVLGQEIDRNYMRTVDFANRFGGFAPDPNQRIVFLQDRADDRDHGRNRLIGQLIFINIAILGTGGFACYALARRTLRPIEDAHEALERFTSDAAHELRTPLITMRTEIEVALMSNKIDSKQAKALLGSNLEEVDRLTHLSERLLLLAQLDNAGLPMTNVAISDIAAKATSLTVAAATSKSIKVLNKASKNTAVVTGDEASLTDLLVMLIDNAIKYSPKDTIITLQATTDSKQVQISVIDQGIGISPQDISHIFERFYRADTSRTGGEAHGYGLGLSLAQKIAHMHNGDLTVTSELGKGSAFILSLPLVSV